MVPGAGLYEAPAGVSEFSGKAENLCPRNLRGIAGAEKFGAIENRYRRYRARNSTKPRPGFRIFRQNRKFVLW